MNESEQERIQRLLKSSLPRIAEGKPARDLWPEMLRRIESETPRVRFGLVDWIITGFAAASVFVFPGVIPGLLYHL